MVSNIELVLKFRHSEKATKFEKNLPLHIWRYWVTSNYKWKIFFSNLCPSQNIWTLRNFFTHFQPSYIINVVYELLPIWEMLKLVVSEIVKISKKRDQFWDFTLKRVPKICDPCILWKPFGTKLLIDCQIETIFSWFFIRYYVFSTKNTFFGILCWI